MELRHLRYIVVSARNGSFSGAAKELHVRQPIISKRIREVEDELGVSLFDRNTTGARLTKTGEEFIIGARRIVDEVQRLTDAAKAIGSGKLGRVVVGFYKSLSGGVLRRALDEFRQDNPEIEVEPVETSYTELRAGVMAGAIDVAVILGETDRCTDLDAMALWSEQLVAVLPDDHPLAERPIIYWPELKGERFLIGDHDPGPDIRNILLRHLAAPSDHPEIVTRHLSRESILSEVGRGQGMSLQCDAVSAVCGLGVVYLPVHEGNGATRLGYIACWRPDNTNPVLKPFLEALKPKC